MNFLRWFLSNHVLANLTFGLILALGAISYVQMPRAKDPELNFNWVNVITFFPGSAAIDVEKRVTSPIEGALRSRVKDMKFVLSVSRDNVSNILVRFKKIDDRTFDKRLIDLRREVQNVYTDQLPDDAQDPVVYEVGTSNAFPSAMVVVTGPGNDENLRRQTRSIRKDLERVAGVDRVEVMGLTAPELHVRFIPERLEGLGITPADISDTIQAYFQDLSAGDLETPGGNWIVRLKGTSPDPAAMQDFPIMTASGVVPLGAVATLSREREEASEIVTFRGRPAANLTIIKQPDANVLQLVDKLNEYIARRNLLKDATGVELFLADDQTVSARSAISLMQNNAMLGLAFVLLVTWLFLGTRIATLTSIGIPFTLAGTFLIINANGFTLNNNVLLGVVIALGMIVDDAVVVVEAIYYRLQRGAAGMSAVIDSFREVFAPVTTSVMTTIAAFLPLILLPGILGDFMRIVPLVVTIALLVSLFEAYWILPAHVLAVKVNFKRPGRISRVRTEFTRRVRLGYTQALLKSLRHPLLTLLAILLVLSLAASALLSGKIRFNFFEFDAIRMFYVNVEMPQGAALEDTSRALAEAERTALQALLPGELRASVTFAGQQFTEDAPVYGETIGQVMFSLNPQTRGGRHIDDIAAEVGRRVKGIPGPRHVSILEMKDGPPSRKAISAKVLGSDYAVMLRAANELQDFLEQRKEYRNVTLDYRPGNPEMVLKLNGEAIQRAGLHPAVVGRALRAFIDGEVVTDFQDEGEEVKVRVLAEKDGRGDVGDMLRQTLSLPDGRSMALSELVDSTPGLGQQQIRHYNFRRAVTLEADIDTDIVNTLQANRRLTDKWRAMQANYPSLSLDLSGELDDIQESLDAIWLLLLLGLGIIYIILGTQFRSYFQPLMIIATVPLAFTGVTLGLLVTQNPMSLYTMYGVVALTGISVNASIVLISAANARRQNGMSVLHATVYAARRRVIPILITSLTTIAGIFSLAAGLAGKSLVWGPMATAIAWGLAFSTSLTLFVIPMLYRFFMSYSHPSSHRHGPAESI